MILYKAIKYIILDVCLESIWNGFIKNFSTSKATRITDLPVGSIITLIDYEGQTFGECEVFGINMRATSNYVTALWAVYKNGEPYRDFVCMERTGEETPKYVTVIKP